ncbi:MAG: protein kinase [Elusimicrobia bacterium]|nr:protein kinase [Elusimicrobiota bacterium]
MPPQVRQNVMNSIQEGDPKRARTVLEQALEQHPDHPWLRSVQRLMAQERPGQALDMKKIQAQALALALPKTWEEGGVAPAQSVLASPLSWAAAPSPAMRSGAGGMVTAPGASPNASIAQHSPLSLQGLSRQESHWSGKIALNPKDWEAHWQRALIRKQLRELRKALADIERSIELNERNAWTRALKALILLDLQRHDEALATADEATRLDPTDARTWATRSLALRRQDRVEESLADLKTAAELDPRQFAQLYSQALGESRGRANKPLFSAANAVYAGAAGLALLIIAAALPGRRGPAEMRSPQPNAATATPPAATIAPPPAAPAAPGAGLRGFQIIRKMGQGGMGIVYEGLDQVLQRKVALKRLREEVAAAPRERKRFLKEARLVASLKHPNIVEIHSVVEQGDELYLVFEHIDGQSLDQILERKKSLSSQETLALMTQVCAALDHAHGQGIIHQDLKPSNIMVSGGTVKVMDFGIARRVLETLSTMSRHEVIGTPAYMAPEQEMGQFSKEADIFALGVCLYETLAGTHPFGCGASYLQKLRQEYRPLTQVSPSLPAGIDQITSRALAPMPAQRYHAAGELLIDLKGVLSPS